MAGSMSDGLSIRVGEQQKTQTFAFVAMTCLFFLWGFITVLNDILIPYFKQCFDLSHTQGMLVQSCFFGAYLIISPFAGKLIDRVGYKNGLLFGLLTAAVGCFLFYPSSEINIYVLFLFSLFVLGSGITVLQVAANPYVTALGPEKTASSRLNLAQSANSLATVVGPLVGATLILAIEPSLTVDTDTRDLIFAGDPNEFKAEAVQIPYFMLAILFLAIASVFYILKLPKLSSVEFNAADDEGGLFNRRQLVFGSLAIFFYVGAEVSIGSMLVDYFKEDSIGGLTALEAGNLVAYYWAGAMIGRLLGALSMNLVNPRLYLLINAVLAVILIVLTVNSSGSMAMWAILAVGFANSIMFPTIFSLAVRGLGPYTSKGSGLICQAIVGGALIPPIHGAVADMLGIQISFLVLIPCYVYIGWYALKGANQS